LNAQSRDAGDYRGAGEETRDAGDCSGDTRVPRYKTRGAVECGSDTRYPRDETRDPGDKTRGAAECGSDTRYSVRFHRCTVQGDWENTQGTADAFCATPSPQLVAGRAGALRATPSRHGIGGAPHPRFADDSARDPAPPTTMMAPGARAQRPQRRPRPPAPAL